MSSNAIHTRRNYGEWQGSPESAEGPGTAQRSTHRYSEKSGGRSAGWDPTGWLTLSLSLSQGLPGWLCSVQTTWLSHLGGSCGNHYRHLRSTELPGAKHRANREGVPELFKERS